MSYICYIDKVEFPTPSKLTVKIKNKNKTLILLNEGEINFLRTPGLSEITVPFVFPMLTSGKTPDYYLNILEKLKTSKSIARFILVRRSPGGRALFDTNMAVSVEDYSIVEDAKDGLDVSVDVSFKQWRSGDSKIAKVAQQSGDSGGMGQIHQTVTVRVVRDASTAPTAKTHIVQTGDTLWALAAKYYGSGAQYARIFDANTDKINNPNILHEGQVLIIP